LIQLTGRSNYNSYSEATGSDYISNPDDVAKPPAVVDVAGWYWNLHDLNSIADKDDLRLITKKINGGYNGIEHRKHLLLRAKEILR
jgi:putative chitinase